MVRLGGVQETLIPNRSMELERVEGLYFDSCRGKLLLSQVANLLLSFSSPISFSLSPLTLSTSLSFRYHLVRGALDFGGVANRTTSRSKYGSELLKSFLLQNHILLLSTYFSMKDRNTLSLQALLTGIFHLVSSLLQKPFSQKTKSRTIVCKPFSVHLRNRKSTRLETEMLHQRLQFTP